MTLNIELDPVLAGADESALRIGVPINIAQRVAQSIAQAAKRLFARQAQAKNCRRQGKARERARVQLVGDLPQAPLRFMHLASIVVFTHAFNTLFMPIWFPSIGQKMAFGISQRAVFQFGGQRVIPAIKEAKCRYHGDNFADFGIREMPLQRIKMGLRGAIGVAGPGLRQRQSGALGLENCGSV